MLQTETQDRFDHLWDSTLQYEMAGGLMNPVDPERAIWTLMFLAQQAEIEELRVEVAERWE